MHNAINSSRLRRIPRGKTEPDQLRSVSPSFAAEMIIFWAALLISCSDKVRSIACNVTETATEPPAGWTTILWWTGRGKVERLFFCGAPPLGEGQVDAAGTFVGNLAEMSDMLSR